MNGPSMYKSLSTVITPMRLPAYAAGWPAVACASLGVDRFIQYLKKFYNHSTVNIFEADESESGRLFYNHDYSSLNFKCKKGSANDFFKEIGEGSKKGIYVGATSVEVAFPGLLAHNSHEFSDEDTLKSIWMCNRIKVACHFDAPYNFAVCLSGKRRFTLFHPSQIKNLYPGPVDFTPAGQIVSLVNFDDPDFDRYPNFKNALESATVIELEAGDAIYIPSMWWHHVESLDDFNVLLNFWWRNSPKYIPSGMDALLHAMLAIRGLNQEERECWRHLFEYYIFSDAEQSVAHLPSHIVGILNSFDPIQAKRIRAILSNRINV
jgi:hypothetical protein